MADFDLDLPSPTFDLVGSAPGIVPPDLPTFDLDNPDFGLSPGTTEPGILPPTFSSPGITVGDVFSPTLGTTSPGVLDQLKGVLKEFLPVALVEKILNKDGSFNLGNLALGGAGGLALASLLGGLGNQQGAPRETYQSLGAAGAAPAAGAPQFQPTRDQAQSYQSMMGYADGGPVRMNSGDFVFSKKALDNVGGIQALRKRGYPAQKIIGPGTGTSDSIPATIDGVEPARVANGEALIRGGADMKGLSALHKQMRRA